MIHDHYGDGVAERLGMSVDDVSNLEPLPGQMLTDEDRRRLGNLRKNGDEIHPSQWGQHTSSVENHPATAEEVMGWAMAKDTATM